ncbi:MAG TPA: choice-of-anchor D domain-containing protein [Candidatus Limnocylindrales bacterium]
MAADTSPVRPVTGATAAPAVLAAPAAPAAPAALPQPPGKTSVISLNPARQFANGSSLSPAISSSGRYVAFASVATDLVSGGSSASSSVYLRDRSNGTTIRLPVPSIPGAVTGGGYAYEPSISADGTVVAFTYRETSDPASPQSVVVWDRKSGQTTFVSQPVDANDASHQPAISGNGRYIAYSSTAPRLIQGYRSQYADVYRFDRQTGQTVLVSVGVSQAPVAGDSDMPSISGDGSQVAFDSAGGQSLTPQASGEGTQVYVRDMNAGTTQQVSIGPAGQAPQGTSGQPSISDDGTLVAFTSAAANFLGGQGAGTYEVYRRDIGAGQTVLVSVMDDGTPMTAASVQPNISRDGRMVAYVVTGALLTAAVLTRQSSSIVLRDVTAGQNAYITVTPTGAQSNSASRSPKVGGAGRFVAFASTGTDLVAGDKNNAVDVFLRDLPPVPKLAPPTIDFGTRAVGVASVATAAGVLSNAGWGPLTVRPATLGGTNAADFSVLADGCKGLSLYRGDACTVTVGFAPSKAGARSAQLQVPDSYTGSPRTARLIGRGSQAKIVLDPPIGQQGIVVVATGSGFPAGAQLQLTWDPGMTPTLPIVTADAKGGFKVQVLVFHHDVVGLRNLVAKWVGGPEFPTLEVPMLVTVRSAVPPGYGVSTGNGPLTILFRG